MPVSAFHIHKSAQSSGPQTMIYLLSVDHAICKIISNCTNFPKYQRSYSSWMKKINFTVETPYEWPSRTFHFWTVNRLLSTFHSINWPDLHPVANLLPSGENLQNHTSSVWSVSSWMVTFGICSWEHWWSTKRQSSVSVVLLLW